MKIKLVMDRDRAINLMWACEVIGRIGMRQFKDMVELLAPHKNYDEGLEIERWLKSKLSNLDENQFYSITNKKIPEECRVAWDVYQHLRREIAWADKRKDWRTDKRDWPNMVAVSYDNPMKVSKINGDFSVERIDEND